jgi:hypothetical protein
LKSIRGVRRLVHLETGCLLGDKNVGAIQIQVGDNTNYI